MAVKRGLKSIKALVVGEAAPTNPGQPEQRSALAQKAMTTDLDALMIEHPRGGDLSLKNGDVVSLRASWTRAPASPLAAGGRL